MKIGVYICHCGVNIAATVDIEKVAAFAKTLPHVRIARDYQYMCSEPGQDLIKKDIEDLDLNRVVVAACSPRMHEVTYRNAARSVGLNPYLVQMANIREQCSWVHTSKEDGTKKAMDLIASAVAKVSLHEPLEEDEVRVTPAVLVIGGGIAGIQASLDIAHSGFEVYLVEKSPTIGGRVAQLAPGFPGVEEAFTALCRKIQEVENHSMVRLLTQSEVEGVEGFVGNFTVRGRQRPRYVDPAKCTSCGRCEDVCPVRVPCASGRGRAQRPAIYLPSPHAIPFSYVIDPESCLFLQKAECGKCKEVCPEGAIAFEEVAKPFEADVGTIVVATGCEPFDARGKAELGYGVYENVMTALEFERLAFGKETSNGPVQINGKEPETVAFIQCVGSRDKTVGNEYCSRVCCSYTVKQALWVRQNLPRTEVTVFYIDVRTFAKGQEELYEEAQKRGVIYRKGVPSELFRRGEKVVLRGEDALLGEAYEKSADLVVLATGLVPSRGAERLRTLLKLPRGPDGFLMEAHPKLRPLDTAADGIFLAGTCQGPKDIADTLAQAHGAASRATTPLFQGKVAIDPVVASIDEGMCSGCGICERVCEYGAPSRDMYRRVMTINPAVCKGCGACHSACPSGAVSLKHFKAEQIMAQVHVLCLGP